MAKKQTLQDFNVGVTLGTGSFGRVRFATDKETGQCYAVKILKKIEVVRLEQVEHINSEKTILEALDHPYIVKLSGTFQDQLNLYMVLEYIVGGEFFTHLRKSGRFDNATARFYGAQIVMIFEYMHNLNIIYRDLKPENLLLDKGGYLKITDFGFAKKVTLRTFTLCGTPEYIAPEVLLNKGHGKPVDWWTLGILLFESLHGQPPFVDDDPMGIYQQILAGKVSFPRYFERTAKLFIKGLLKIDTTKRLGSKFPGVASLKGHKWMATEPDSVDWTSMELKTVVAPIIPNVKNDTDTSNFDPYPESTEETQPPIYSDGNDPFLDF